MVINNGEEIPFDEVFPTSELEGSKYKQPIVRRNKNDKTISVTAHFRLNKIKIKIIAPYQTWIDWEKIFQSYSAFDFHAILPYISSRTPKKNIYDLKTYYESDPYGFANDLLSLYIIPANQENPDYQFTRKKRGGSPYSIDQQAMYKAKHVAQHLHVLLQHWREQPQADWPDALKCLGVKDSESSEDIIKRIVEHEFQIQVIALDDKTFRDKYIYWRPLRTIKNSYKSLDYQPRIPYLNPDNIK